MAGSHWYDLVLLISSLGMGVVLLGIFYVAINKNNNLENLLFFVFSFFLFLTTIFTLLNGLSGSKTASGIGYEPGNYQVVFWFANFLMSISFFWYSAVELGIFKSTSRKTLALVFASGITISWIISAANLLDMFPSKLILIVLPLFSIFTKISSAWIYLRTDHVSYKFFLYLPVIQLIGLDIAIVFSLPFIVISLTTSVVFSGVIHTTFWSGLFEPLLTQNKELQAEIEKGIEANLKIEELNHELLDAYETTLEGWAKTLELRDKETEGHSRRVTTLASELAAAMNMSEEDQNSIRFGALLHDIGKMAISNDILRKPGPLSKEERSIIERHPTYAFDLLKDIKFLKKAIEIPAHHHERWDGTGYPHNLKAENIPLLARMFSVIDVWDALTTDRPYSKAWTPQQAKQYITEEAGRHFDSAIVKSLF